jgi:ribosomal protein L7/L12
MKINIYYESKIYSTTIKNQISANTIIENIKNISNQKTQNFILLNESKIQISKTELISPKDKTTQNFYLIKQSNNYIEKEKEKEEEPIENMIMNATGAKIKLIKKVQQVPNRLNTFDPLLNGGNVGRLLDLIQFLEERNMIVQIRNNQEGNNIEANENLVNQLKDMGFPEDRARDALIRSRNELSIATNILLGEE